MIIVKNAVKIFDNEIHATDNVSFHISSGEKVGLIGVNGAGKTTLIRLICGLLRPDSGYIRVFRREPLSRDKTIGMKMGMVYGLGAILAGKGKVSFGFDALSCFAGSGNLDSELTIKNNFELIQTIYRIPQDLFWSRFDELDEALGVKEYMNYHINQLSLGQKMRAEIASVLIYEPELLILDEPFVGIDVSAKEAIRMLLKKLSMNKNTTIILVTHNVEEIEKICNRVMFLDRGKMIYDGSFDKIKYLHGCMNTISVEFDEKIPDLQDLPIVKYEIENHRMKAWHNSDIVSAKEITAFIVSRYRIKDLLIHKPTIEEMIKSIYGGIST